MNGCGQSFTVTNKRRNMKAWRISAHYRSLTIYHTDKDGKIMMTTKTTPNKGLTKRERVHEIASRLISEGIMAEQPQTN